MWRNGRYDEESNKWIVGRKLPDGIPIFGIHQYKEGHKFYNNYIVNEELFYVINNYVGIVNHMLQN